MYIYMRPWVRVRVRVSVPLNIWLDQTSTNDLEVDEKHFSCRSLLLYALENRTVTVHTYERF